MDNEVKRGHTAALYFELQLTTTITAVPVYASACARVYARVSALARASVITAECGQ